ncbi:MAG: hypothetical protein MR616_01810, partial [Pyramidobacter sp.]|nr:hypothetical protein [Pyramidobacter sp.]
LPRESRISLACTPTIALILYPNSFQNFFVYRKQKHRRKGAELLTVRRKNKQKKTASDTETPGGLLSDKMFRAKYFI